MSTGGHELIRRMVLLLLLLLRRCAGGELERHEERLRALDESERRLARISDEALIDALYELGAREHLLPRRLQPASAMSI